MSSLLNSDEQQAAANAPEHGLVPEGVYTCRVFDIERWGTGVSLCWKLKVAYGERHAGWEFWTWTSLKHESIGRTKAYLTTLGFGLDADPSEIIGTPCKVRVTIEPRSDTGERVNRVKQLLAYEGAPLPDEPDPVEAPADDFGGRDLC